MININEKTSTGESRYALAVERGDIVACMTPEGLSDDFCCTIILEGIDSPVRYRLKHVFHGKIVNAEDDSYYMNAFSVATAFMKKIKAKGYVDLYHWKQEIDCLN